MRRECALASLAEYPESRRSDSLAEFFSDFAGSLFAGYERAHFDKASAILDSNSEEAWRKTKMRPREWELG